MMQKQYLWIQIVFLGFFWARVDAGTIVGRVADESDHAVHDAAVLILELNRGVRADTDGNFRFDDVPPGSYRLQVSAKGFGSNITMVEVAETGETRVTLTYDMIIHEDLVISATPQRKSISDVSQAVGVLNEEELYLKMQPTIGETLAQEPGVSSTSFGPGASRPIIRGLGGGRIQMLEGGLGTGDASSTSADHAVGTDPMSAERIETLRGPASLRYGSSAVGGVVNVIDNRIPEYLPAVLITGKVHLQANTVADEKSSGLALQGSVRRMAWHADFFSKETHDYEIPGPAEADHDEEIPENPGFLENSALETQKGSIGFSYVADRAFIGASYTGYNSEYGVPGHGEEGHHEEEGHDEEEADHEEGEEEAPVTIDLDQKRIDVRGGIRLEDAFIQSVGLRVGATDYQHFELEGPEIGTRFFNDYRELRAEAVHGRWGSLTSGSFGIQVSDRDFEAIGEEAFVPPNRTKRYAAYLYEESEREAWSLSFGARIERQDSQAEPLAHDHENEEKRMEDASQGFDLSFSGVSTSLGLVLGRNRSYSAGVNLTQTQRAPTPEELFSNGPHLATSSFEVGDPNLDKETSLGLDVIFRKKEGPFTGELSLFVNRFNDFIYERFRGDEEDGLPVFLYTQEDADFWGGEFHMDASLWHTEPHHLTFEATYDYVRAELDSGEPLPRVPPQRLSLDLHYRRPHFWAKAGVRFIDDQDRVSSLETATDGHTFLNAAVGYRFFLGSTVQELLLRGQNLTDTEARNHSSFIKDRVLLPGRDLMLAFRLQF